MKNCIIKILVMTLFAVGCIGCGNGLVKVSGKVTYNGTPVEEGEIRFLPASGKGPSTAAMIIDGQYSLEMAPGEKKVKIFGNKVVGKQDIGIVVGVKKQYLPAKFNEKTELTSRIGSGETHDFNLP